MRKFLTEMLLLLTTIFVCGNCLLFSDNNVQTTSTEAGPLGLEATVSLLVQEVSRLNSDMRAQENEIQNLKMQLKNRNTTLPTMDTFLTELSVLNSTVNALKSDIDIMNHSSGTQIILRKIDNMSKSIQYMVLSLQEQDTKIETNNHSIHEDLELLKTQLRMLSEGLVSLNSTERLSISSLQSQLTKVQSTVSGLQMISSSVQYHISSLQSKYSSLQTSVGRLQNRSSQESSKLDSLGRDIASNFRHLVLEPYSYAGWTSILHYGGTRLVGGSSSYGRVEINVNGVWGTVCDDSFDSNNNAAKVVCRSLGQSWHYAVSESSSVYGQGDEDQLILLDGVSCNGNEANINECSHGHFGHHDCSHSEDVGVRCD